MKNLNIGGSIYQNVERLYLKDENGVDVVYVDEEIIERAHASAQFVGWLRGEAFTLPTASTNRRSITAHITQEV